MREENKPKIDLLRDSKMDEMMQDIIDIFTIVEGVELVRLSGMTNRAKKISGKQDMNAYAVDKIIRTLNANKVISYGCIIKCPHCGEISYVLNYSQEFHSKPKMCDTCNTFYKLQEGSTIEVQKK